MTCAMLDERLDDWVDGTLSQTEARELEAHLAACPSCRDEAQKLRTVLAHATALPRSVAPSRNLWPGVASRIERERRWSWTGSPATWLAVAAAVVFATLAVVAYQNPTAPEVVLIEDPPAGHAVRPAAAALDPGLAEMERDYQSASNALLLALQERKDQMSGETLKSVEQNIAVIDRALAEVREALAKDPASPELGQMLMSTHRKKVEVLRQMVKRSTDL